MIRVGKYNWRQHKEPKTPGFINVLIHTSGELSPYVMKDTEGIIMENWWQFSKIFNAVDAQKQPISQYMMNRIRWEHPAEVHFQDQSVTPEYWAWRDKGMHHDKWVRYPNGYAGHATVLGSVIGNADNYEIVDKFVARKRIYFAKYREIAIQTATFQQLKDKLANGVNIQINEVDGPAYDAEEDPHKFVVNGSLEMNEENLRKLINNSKYSFGHGYALAACLMDIDLEHA